MLGKKDEQIVGEDGAARGAGDIARFPSEHPLDERPGIGEGRFGGFRSDNFGDDARVDWRLPLWRQSQFLEKTRRDDETNRRDVVNPFEVWVSIAFYRHCAHPDAGQR
jgi:hypothetical protein